MKPPLALLACLPLIVWFWKRDQRARPSFSTALWIPLVWVLLLGSRPLSFWLGIGGSGNDLEGNSFDRLFYLGMIFLSIYILSKRRIRWGQVIGQNKGLALFYLFLLATMLWSEYPLVTFKRWFKDLGSVFIILLILSEQHPIEALKATLARCAYVLFPLSVVFIKYFPQLGREFSHSGAPTYTGVTTQKNSLGEIVLVFGLLLVSELARPNKPAKGQFFKSHHWTIILILAVGLWLLFGSDSKTSLICLSLGTAILLSYKLPFFKNRPKTQLSFFATLALLFVLVNNVFGLTDELLRMVGRDPTLTHRTEIWEAVRQNPVDPLFGCGYLMYWDLHKTITIGDFSGVSLNSAHNG
jgi:exopolysaccharide production protein ExoQ